MTSAKNREGTPMAQMLVMYKTPADAAAFDRHFFDRHIAITKRSPGLRRYEISQGPVMSVAGPSNYHLIAALQYDDFAAIQRAMASVEGQAVMASARNLGAGGIDLLMFNSRQV